MNKILKKDLLLLWHNFLKLLQIKVLVTGANGLLGHNVELELLKRKQLVRIIVCLVKRILLDTEQNKIRRTNWYILNFPLLNRFLHKHKGSRTCVYWGFQKGESAYCRCKSNFYDWCL